MKITVQKDKDYTVMSNYYFKDKESSLRTKWLLSMMLSLPDSWNYSLNGIIVFVLKLKKYYLF